MNVGRAGIDGVAQDYADNARHWRPLDYLFQTFLLCLAGRLRLVKTFLSHFEGLFNVGSERLVTLDDAFERAPRNDEVTGFLSPRSRQEINCLHRRRVFRINHANADDIPFETESDRLIVLGDFLWNKIDNVAWHVRLIQISVIQTQGDGHRLGKTLFIADFPID